MALATRAEAPIAADGENFHADGSNCSTTGSLFHSATDGSSVQATKPKLVIIVAAAIVGQRCLVPRPSK